MAWVQNSACQKPKELGYAQKLWTYGLLTAHLRREARSAGYPELEQVSQETVVVRKSDSWTSLAIDGLKGS
jgi:hypothetical protein